MDSIGDFLKKNEVIKKRRSKRSLLVKQLAERLIKYRESNPYYAVNGKVKRLPPLTDKQIAIRVSHYSEEQLEDLYSTCKHSKNFSKTFWYLTKVFLEETKE